MTTTVQLGDFVELTMGQAPPGDSYNDKGDGLPLVAGAGDFNGDGLAPTKYTTRPSKLSRAGDIVLSIRASIGAKVWADGVYCLGRGVAGLRARPGLDSKFLWHWLTHTERELAAKGRGATFLQVNRTDIAGMQLTLPPIEEQRRIAAILDQADAIRTTRRQVLARLDALTQSTFHAMFGNERVAGPLGERLEFLTSGSRGWARYYTDHGAKFIRIQNVGRGELRLDDMAYVNPPATAEARRTAVQAGDVLLSITADLGRTAVVPVGFGEAYISQHLAVLRAPTLIPAFLSAYLQSRSGQMQIQKKDRGATKAGLNFDDVRSIEVPMPPVDSQRAFAARVDAINAQRGAVERALAADGELFASLQSRAFQGEL